MANPSKKKGTDAEVAVRDYLREHGFPYAERLPSDGINDRGDITGIPGVVIEIKAEKGFLLGPWLEETERERINAGAPIGVCWHKRRGKSDPGKWFVTMTGEQFINLLRDHQEGT